MSYLLVMVKATYDSKRKDKEVRERDRRED